MLDILMPSKGVNIIKGKWNIKMPGYSINQT